MDNNIKILDSMEEYRLAKEFWLERLSAEMSPLNFIHDHMNHACGSKGVDEFSLDPGLAARLLGITRSQDMLIYVTLLSVLSVELMKYTGDKELLIGIPPYHQQGGRGEELSPQQHLIYHTDLRDRTMNFKQWMGKVKNDLFAIYSHQHYPLQHVLEILGLDYGVQELLPVSLVMDNLHTEEAIRCITDSPHNLITLSFVHDGDQVRGRAIFNPNLLKVETVQRFVLHYLTLLEDTLAHPDQQITAFRMMSAQERQQILTEFNHPAVAYPANLRLPELFETQVAKTPDQRAIIMGEKILTYRELNAKANQLARRLQERGVGADMIVGIMIERSLEMIIGIMGILKAGGAYLPMSTDDPEDRIRFMLEDSGAKLLLTRSELRNKVTFAGETLYLEDQTLYQGDATNLDVRFSSRDLAYVIYTSGTTGKPKGVMVEHHSVVNRLHWLQRVYPAGADEVMMQKTPYTFDVSVWEIFGWFCSGSTLCLLPLGGEKEPAVMVETIQRHSVNIIHFVPSMLNMFLDYIERLENLDGLASLWRVHTSGEALTVKQVERFKQTLHRLHGTQLLNLYGPTEATVEVSYFDCTQAETLESVPIGKPIDNIQLYIVDEQLGLQPIGIPGELCISGVGLARGYLNRPELTAEKFVPYPFQDQAGEGTQRMYRTGDLARWLPDGDIEFLGRMDHQVKIRGLRIELGEIEYQIAQIPGVQATVVVDRKDDQGQSYLCAYLVAEKEFTVGELRELLLQTLPEYMIPTYFVRLAQIPLTSNGKINRNALPEPDGSISTGAHYEPPATETEEKLTDIWEKLLKIERIGVDDNFFELGGHSLKGAVMAARVQEVFHVPLSLGEIFRTPTIRGLAAYIDQAESRSLVTIPRVEEREYYPAWPGQVRLFTLQEIDPGSVVYNMSSIYTIEGRLDRSRLERAFNMVIQRHETLRTCFTSVNNEIMMKVLPEVPFQLEYGEMDSEEGIEKRAAEFIRPFDLRKAPLLRAKLWTINEEKHVLMYDMHHIITDGVGGNVLIQNLAAFYAGEELPPLQIQYKDFAVWQKDLLESEQVKHHEEYLLEVFSGELPVLNLPTDYPRPSIKSTVGSTAYLTIEQDLTGRLRKLALETESTLYMVVLTAFYTLLYKYSGQEDIIVGSPAAGRPNVELEEIIGLFINNIVMRNYPKGTKPFKEFLQEIKTSSLGAIEHQEYQFDQLIEKLNLPKDLSRNPLFDIFFAFQNYEFAQVDLADVQIIPYLYDHRIAKFDLLLFTYDHQDTLVLDLEYNTGLYQKETVERMLRHYLNLLTQIVKNPDQTLGELDMLSEDERHQLLFDFNRTNVEYPTGKAIHVLFEEQAKRTPENIAVSFGDRRLTYRELNRQANWLARKLVKQGVGRESVVGIMLDKSCEMVVSLLAILKAGGAYLPIDPDYPQERILYMLKDANARLLLTDRASQGELPITLLKNLDPSEVEIVATPLRNHIREFDQLPMPDRSLIDLNKYKGTIGMASVTNCISLQTTRGCPYQCLFCHKVWSKNHVFRSAEKVYEEVEYYYRRGVTHFEILDDCFNLNAENGKRFFALILKNGLKVQIFFPNGLRGDLLTPEYIDLMVAAGVVNINLSLETASPRLQKLIKKNLDLDRFKSVMEYIATRHPNVILELATMHGFPTESEEEAMMTLNFIKDIRWIHFPYIHILKVYPNTEMEQFALEHGVSREDIQKSVNLAYHEIPETLPFPKSFTRKYQAEFLSEYFLRPERLKAVLPVQLGILSEEALVQKYNAYLPADIQSLDDVVRLAGMTDFDLSQDRKAQQEIAATSAVNRLTVFDRAYRANSGTNLVQSKVDSARKILLLDLSQSFSTDSMLYKVTEQPLGLLYLLTYLKQELGDQIDGRIYKSGVDFDSFAELRQIVHDYQPDLIGIRTLSLYKEFFHETVALLKQWVPEVTILTGGPYATSDYEFILKDHAVDLAIVGEGEYTLTELVKAMLAHQFQLPPEEVLQQIHGIAYAKPAMLAEAEVRDVLYIDELQAEFDKYCTQHLRCEGNQAGCEDLNFEVSDHQLAYVMYTSGSTGKPKGVLVEHRQVNNCINWMQQEFRLDETAVVAQRTNLTFDPSVWEIFWPLYIGARVDLLTRSQGKDAQYLIQRIKESTDWTMLYCPASMVTAMTYLLNQMAEAPGCLRVPWFLIGAEAIQRDVVNQFYQFLDGTMVNTYGPTECAINNTYCYLQRNDPLPIVPIGRPIANNQLYILSNDLNPRPVNLPGEIYIAGKSVARGYINSPGQTEARFLTNPFGQGKLYRTGDLGCWLPDGNIEIIGRTDDQVKIRGYRIELGEIETALLKHKSITECAVIVRDSKDDIKEVQFCEQCGISTEYPHIAIHEDGICNTCSTLAEDQAAIQGYFQSPGDLAQLITAENQGHAGDYDCLLLYAGGLASGYALYQLVEQGFRVLTATYNHGYFTKSDLDNIKEITRKLGVDHVVLTHDKTNAILKESMHKAATVCKGCFFTSSALAADYAKQHGIKVVVGATLSRGQIIENKVYDLVKRGIVDVREMEQELANIQKMNPDLNHSIFELIGIDEVNHGTIYDEVKMVDFYRYYDLTNEEMLNELYSRDAYWKTRKDYAIYSTKCPIKEIGDYYHLQEKGFHYYGSATAWEYRLRHLTKQNVKDDLTCHVNQQSCDNFLRILGFEPDKSAEELESKYICAYLVADEEISVSDLRGYLSKHVPEYMIPSYFVHLSEMPLTQEGKIHRKALPIPEGDMFTGVEFVAPRNEMEVALAQVWQEVLGVDQVGIEDNFFDLGGDSIRAIRVISGAQRHGYKLEVKDLFTNPKIKDLSSRVTRNQTTVPQELVIGEIPLLPIQRWFFAHRFTNPHHWNQSVMLYKPDGFDQAIVERVFAKLIEHHDILRACFEETAGSYLQWNRDISGELFSLQVFDYTAKPLNPEAVRHDTNQIQEHIELTTGPLVRLGLFKTADGDHLLIVIHHLVMDGISWRILFEDFALGYEQIQQGKSVTFQDKTNSYQDWARYLKEYAASTGLRKEAEYWNQLASTAIPPLPKDRIMPKEQRKRSHARNQTVSLSPAQTRDLLTQVNKAYNTEINDILLTALGQTIKQWTGTNHALIQLEGHGREQLTDNLDITRTVGWFTTQYPVILDLSHDEESGYLIKSTKEMLRRIPNKGIGYGILHYVSEGALYANLDPEINFNYLGQFDQDLKGELFEFSNLPTGENISPDAETLYTLDINGMVVEGKFQISFTYHGDEYRDETIRHVSEMYKTCLCELIEHCIHQEGTEYTPTDYGNSNISLAELQDLEESLQEIFSEEESNAEDLDDVFADF